MKFFPQTAGDIKEMLDKCGVKQLDDLYADIPESIRFRGEYDIPSEMSELEIREFFTKLANQNQQLVCFAGAGVYDHYTPSLIPQITSRSEFLTSYTPYQAEISQGTLHYIFEYQSMMAELTGMDISNASLYDGSTATAEAAMMANSYSKTDYDATFMRVKSDYMGNDQLLPAYNMQAAICDEYIAVIDAKPYASDMECFVPLMEKFNSTYGHYPKYPVADAGYGSYNNYLYCEEHGMEKYMKFTMFDKETKDSKYHNNPYRVDNFECDETGNLICPNGKRFVHKYDKHVKGNKYGRTEEIYECEDCSGCPYKNECCKRTNGNRTARLNRELTAIHHEVIDNLESIHGALLRMNRSIQAEGTFGVIKWDRTYKRLFRRGEKAVILEFTLISCGFNLYKYHNKINRQTRAA